jgi:TolB-like protein/tetratricopeptide (TPR) repeat protein
MTVGWRSPLRYQFGEYSLDKVRRELRRGDGPVHVEPQVFDLLLHLIDRRGEVVTRDDLIQNVWGGRIVSESTLSSRINAARQAVGDSGQKQEFIRTVSRRGVMFVGEVREDAESDGRKSGPAPSSAPPLESQPLAGTPAETGAAPPLPDKPSIAVLPFANLSGDPEQEYFADGMVDEIITSLARIHGLIVTARTSTFMFKGQNADIREIARKLNVRYVLEGSVRKAADRLRIIGQLIDADTGAHIWAGRVEGRLDDVFDLQDRITESVVGAIAPKMLHAEIERATRKRPENLDTYDYYLRGLVHFHHPTAEGVEEALGLMGKGLALDPDYAPLNVLAAWFHFYRIAASWSPSFEEDREVAVRLARTALEHDDGDPFVLSLAGFLLASMGRDVGSGVAAAERAVALSPNSAPALNQAGYTLMFAGDPERALKFFNAAVRLSPSDPLTYRALTGACGASVLAGRYAEAAAYGEEARRHYAGWSPTFRWLAAAYGQLGDADKAAETMAVLRRLDPTITISHMRSYQPYQNAEQAERMWEGLRKAGLPE